MNVILTAFPYEYKLIESLMQDYKKKSAFEGEGSIANKKYHLLNVGQGPKRSTSTLSYFLKAKKTSNEQLDAIFMIGFCGGINPNLKIGDIIHPSKVYTFAQGDLLFLETSKGTEQALFTSSFPLTSVHDKALHFKKTKCDAVDMESYFIVKLAHDFKVPVQIIKCVMDDASMELPEISSQSDPYLEKLQNILKDLSPHFKNFLTAGIL